MPEPTNQREMERACKLAELRAGTVPARLSERDVDIVCRALLRMKAAVDRMEPVEVLSQIGVEDAIRQCTCGYGPLFVQFNYCPNCGRPIKWKDAECRKS